MFLFGAATYARHLSMQGIESKSNYNLFPSTRLEFSATIQTIESFQHNVFNMGNICY